MKMRMLDIKAEIFQEDELYVALCPSLNVSSYGDTLEAARQSLAEAVEAFIEECHEMGTLEEVLEESGFVKTSSAWQARQPVKEMNLAIAI
jgi:predicted RNase H-like HicB family nuclease